MDNMNALAVLLAFAGGIVAGIAAVTQRSLLAGGVALIGFALVAAWI